MISQILHTPDGVRDIYGDELVLKNEIINKVYDTFHLNGFKDIETPTFEFFDVFSKDIGTIPSKELYKFFDKEGNTLVLRPDFTPSVARALAKYFKEEKGPLKFCYKGNTFINTSEYQGKLKETTQIGVEMVNENSIYADAQMICLVIDTLLATGLKEFVVSIGDTEFFKGLCSEANITEEIEINLREYISSKNFYMMKEYLANNDINSEIIDQFGYFSKTYLEIEDLKNLKDLVNNKNAIKALDRLLLLKDILSKKGYDKYIAFDLSMLSKYHYYTGIIFKAYTYGVGDAIIKGGRYDNLLEKFGKSASAIGFVVLADELLTSIMRTGHRNVELKKKVLITFKEDYLKADEKALELRKSGIIADVIKEPSMNKEDFETYVEKGGYSEVITI